jgi:hypothetical protein
MVRCATGTIRNVWSAIEDRRLVVGASGILCPSELKDIQGTMNIYQGTMTLRVLALPDGPARSIKERWPCGFTSASRTRCD